MPNTKSAAKAQRGSERKRLRNKSTKTALNTMQKSFLASVAKGNKDQATALLPKVISALDKAAKGGIIHPNRAARQKSRLSIQLRGIKTAAK